MASLGQRPILALAVPWIMNNSSVWPLAEVYWRVKASCWPACCLAQLELCFPSQSCPLRYPRLLSLSPSEVWGHKCLEHQSSSPCLGLMFWLVLKVMFFTSTYIKHNLWPSVRCSESWDCPPVVCLPCETYCKHTSSVQNDSEWLLWIGCAFVELRSFSINPQSQSPFGPMSSFSKKWLTGLFYLSP